MAAWALLAPALLAGCSGASGAADGMDGGGTSSSGGMVPLDPDAAAPPGFWDSSNIPPAKNALVFKFLNRTGGKFPDTSLYWSFKSGAITETHSFAVGW
jgi:hypothetical protein